MTPTDHIDERYAAGQLPGLLPPTRRPKAWKIAENDAESLIKELWEDFRQYHSLSILYYGLRDKDPTYLKQSEYFEQMARRKLHRLDGWKCIGWREKGEGN